MQVVFGSLVESAMLPSVVTKRLAFLLILITGKSPYHVPFFLSNIYLHSHWSVFDIFVK